ncbi:hypothetical protein TIFTF001_033120 [Ficus carica]|uniref:Uncharacterized protein n=1 Tax=Ficus carica TaxID=3494 RepID=A0AA88DYA1_FICCA|nr:hypothetical protein TIFTF001_033120 [Ficus carica]
MGGRRQGFGGQGAQIWQGLGRVRDGGARARCRGWGGGGGARHGSCRGWGASNPASGVGWKGAKAWVMSGVGGLEPGIRIGVGAAGPWVALGVGVRGCRRQVGGTTASGGAPGLVGIARGGRSGRLSASAGKSPMLGKGGFFF